VTQQVSTKVVNLLKQPWACSSADSELEKIYKYSVYCCLWSPSLAFIVGEEQREEKNSRIMHDILMSFRSK
jgi:hypothetical protein